MLDYQKTRICLFGDGLMSHIGSEPGLAWNQQLMTDAQSQYPKLKCYQLGIEEDTSLELMLRIADEADKRFLNEGDNRLVICLGINDTFAEKIKPQLSTKESIAHMTTVLIDLRKQYKILIVGPSPVFDPQQNQRIKRLSGALAELCQKARVGYISLFNALLDDVEYKREVHTIDNLHPGQKGHDKIFEIIKNERIWWFSPR
jgi:acyl-CoA thioesterase I